MLPLGIIKCPKMEYTKKWPVSETCHFNRLIILILLQTHWLQRACLRLSEVLIVMLPVLTFTSELHKLNLS